MTTATVTRSSTECIAEDFVLTSQSCEYTNIVSTYLHRGPVHHVDPTCFRVVIRRDSYENQSYARVEVWRRDGWTLVHALHGQDERVSDLPTKHQAAHDLAGAREQFGDLSTDLLNLATRVVA